MRLRGKLAEIEQRLWQRMPESVVVTGNWPKSVMQGYFNYPAIPGNADVFRLFRCRVTRLWRHVPDSSWPEGLSELGENAPTRGAIDPNSARPTSLHPTSL
jgi:hypothetical protein